MPSHDIPLTAPSAPPNLLLICRPHSFFISSIFALLLTASALSQPLQREWVRNYSLLSTNINKPVAIAVGPDGNVVVAGSSQNPEGDFDYEVIKYRPNGDEAWKIRYGSPADDQLRGMTIDPNGNIIITGTTDTVKYTAEGFFVWVASLGGRALIANSNFVYVTGLSDTDIVTVQLDNTDTEGNELWRRVFDGRIHREDIGQAITLDPAGNIYVAGQAKYPDCTDGICVARFAVLSYSPEGVQRWVQDDLNVGQKREVTVTSLLVHSDTSVYVCGNPSGVSEPYIAKFNPNGALVWSGHSSAPVVTGMIENRSTHNVLVTGRRGTTDINANPAIVASYSGTGTRTQIWSYLRPVGGENVNEGSALAQDSVGNVFVAGYSFNGYSTNGLSTYALLLAKISPTGTQLGLDRFNSPNAGSNFGTALAVDTNDNVYVTGYVLNTQGGSEFVTVKYSAPPKIEKKTSGAMQLQFRTSPGQPYAIEATTNFLNWLGLTTNIADANGLIQFDDTNAVTIPYRFYRGNASP